MTICVETELKLTTESRWSMQLIAERIGHTHGYAYVAAHGALDFVSTRMGLLAYLLRLTMDIDDIKAEIEGIVFTEFPAAESLWLGLSAEARARFIDLAFESDRNFLP